MKTRVPCVEQINLELKEHQKRAHDWEQKGLVENLHLWAERFISEFKLKATVPALMLGQLRRSTLGHFRPGRNGFGLVNEIAVNLRHISEERYWRALATLLHELLHAEQEVSGTPGKGNYHNKEFRNRANSLGLLVDSRGRTAILPAPSLFTDILEKYGVDVPELPKPVSVFAGTAGTSKLKLWVCSCQPKPVRVRVAIKDFRARCLKCNQMFVRRTQVEDGYWGIEGANGGKSRRGGRTEMHIDTLIDSLVL